MDNCLLGHSEFFPKWYVNSLKLFPNYKVYNNYYNLFDVSIYNIIDPNYGLYSLKNIEEIFTIHPELKNSNITVLKYDNNFIFRYEYDNQKRELILKNTFPNYAEYEWSLHNLLNDILTNQPRFAINQYLLLGILKNLINRNLEYNDIVNKLRVINVDKCLKYYISDPIYDSLYLNLVELINSYNIIPNEFDTSKKKTKIFKIKYTPPNNVLVNPVNILGGGINKKFIVFYLLHILYSISSFCKKSKFILSPLPVNKVIDDLIEKNKYLSKKNKKVLLDLLKILIKKNVIILREKTYFISADFEQKVLDFFSDNNKWWYIDRSIKKVLHLKYNEDRNLSQVIFDNFKVNILNFYQYNNNNYLATICDSGCDCAFANNLFKLNNSLAFLKTQSSIWNSFPQEVTSKVNGKSISHLNGEYHLDFFCGRITLNNSKINIFEYKNLILTPGQSQNFLISNILKNNPSNLYNLEYNQALLELDLQQIYALNTSMKFLQVVECLDNKMVLYTKDPILNLYARHSKISVIYERIKNGRRFLELN